MDTKPICLCLIDDDPIQYFILERIVHQIRAEKKRIIIHYFKDPIEFLATLEESLIECNIILLDINMPMMNGFELLQKIQPYLNKIKVFMFTSSDSKSDRDQASGFLSVKDFIVKPIDSATLLNVINRV